MAYIIEHGKSRLPLEKVNEFSDELKTLDLLFYFTRADYELGSQ